MRHFMDIFFVQQINELFKGSFISIILIYIISSNIIINPEIIQKYTQLLLIYLFNKHQIILEGNRTNVISAFENHTVENYSPRFNAIWFYITKNIYNSSNITEIREMNNVKQPDGKTKDIFIVSQKYCFLLEKKLKIYGFINMIDETNKDEKTGTGTNVKFKNEKIEINLYSYYSSLTTIETFIEKITEDYLNSIKNLRKNRLFYYVQTEVNAEKEVYNCFREIPFDSSSRFDNLFFPEKREIMDKIQFFVENRDWYYKMGIPYTLGIGIHGPPGTGKTSFTKCLANYLHLNIIELSFKLIKTKKQLQDFYFETRYNKNNQENDIGFDKKIILFEDLDCAGDIFIDRSKKQKKQKEMKINEKNQINPVEKIEEDPITLDDILNLWDGLYETPGRIIIISSNHYNTLDPALIRPGRIDITLEMKKVTKETIKEMYFHFFNLEFTENEIQLFRENYYTPAEIINIYISCRKNPVIFREILFSCLTNEICL